MNRQTRPGIGRCEPRGFSLVELMVAIGVGLVVAAAITSLFISLVRSDSSNLKSIRLNQELRATMSLMTRDLRRAGFNNDAVDDVLASSANPFQQMTVGAGNDCIIYAYDENKDGVYVASDELFGFRLNGDAIARLNGADCAGGGTKITDDDLIAITEFTVSDPDLPGDVPEETVTPGKTVSGITTHQITFTLAGRLVSDTSVKRTITETVETRNVEY